MSKTVVHVEVSENPTTGEESVLTQYSDGTTATGVYPAGAANIPSVGEVVNSGDDGQGDGESDDGTGNDGDPGGDGAPGGDGNGGDGMVAMEMAETEMVAVTVAVATAVVMAAASDLANRCSVMLYRL